MKQSNYLWVIDAGHGGVDPKTGIYSTAPSKMFDHGNGVLVREGVLTRIVAEGVALAATNRGWDVVLTYDTVLDWGLSKRCQIASRAATKEGVRKAIFLSIHYNAGPSANLGKGWEIYTSPGQDDSDPVADVFYRHAQRMLPWMTFRSDKISDGDVDKEAKFFVILPSNNACHARVLTENGFYTDINEAKWMLTKEGQQAVIDLHVNAMNEIEINKPI